MLQPNALKDPLGRLLFVDDEPGVLSALKRLFERQYDVVLAENAQSALDCLENEVFDLVITDMRMPGMSGADLLKECYSKYPDMIRVLLTGYSDLESTIQAVNEGNIHRYISKPWDNDHLRTVVAEAIESRDLKDTNRLLNDRISEQNSELERLNNELRAKYEASASAVGEAEQKLDDAYKKLRSEFDAIVQILVATLELRLGEESGSILAFAKLVRSFAKAANIEGEQLRDIFYAAQLRNLGKVPLPDALLAKSVVQMNQPEKFEYAQFTIYGQTSLMLLGPLHNAASIIRSHMELYNGRGFPDRLSGNAIPQAARIIRIVSDFIEAQREHNFLGQILSEEEAKEYIKQSAGQRYDAELVDVFMQVLESYEGDLVPSMERILITDVKPGMVLTSNLVSPGGTVLLAAGTEFNERMVEKMHALSRQFSGHEIFLHVKRSLLQTIAQNQEEEPSGSSS